MWAGLGHTDTLDLQNKSTAAYPGDVLHPEEADDDVVVRRPGQELHRHRAKLLQARFWPVLEAGLGGRRQVVSARSGKDQSQRELRPVKTIRHQ